MVNNTEKTTKNFYLIKGLGFALFIGFMVWLKISGQVPISKKENQIIKEKGN